MPFGYKSIGIKMHTPTILHKTAPAGSLVYISYKTNEYEEYPVTPIPLTEDVSGTFVVAWDTPNIATYYFHEPIEGYIGFDILVDFLVPIK